jgi:purine nucleoside phosphorylase
MGEMEKARGLAIIAGSGMAALADRLASRLADRQTVRFDEIDGVGACTVEGHRGEVWLGRLHDGSSRGRLGRRLALVLGRRHAHEGGELGMAALMRWLAARGVSDVVSVSAAGSLCRTLRPGELVVIRGLIDLQNRDSLQPGPRRPRVADGFRGEGPALERGGGGRRAAVSARLTLELEAAARRVGVGLQRGVLACGAGPAYETRAEVGALQAAGADVATMSAAPEAQYASELGMEIAMVVAVTNWCTGIGSESPDHHRVLEEAGRTCGALAALLLQFT